MTERKWSDATRERVLEMYANGDTCAKITAETGVPRATIFSPGWVEPRRLVRRAKVHELEHVVAEQQATIAELVAIVARLTAS